MGKKKINNDLTKYYAVRDQMMAFDLLQWRGNYPMSKAIRKVTGEEVNHTSVVVRIPWMEHVVFSIEALDDGLHLYPLSELLRKYDGWCEWTPVQEQFAVSQQNIRAVQWLMIHLGRKYDWSGCISNWRELLGKEPRHADSGELFCSESVFLAAKECIVRETDPTQTRCGARLPWLADVKVAPVPGKDVLKVIRFWQEDKTQRIL